MSTLLQQGDLAGKKIYLIGIKGTGMATIALWLQQQGVLLSGSDSPEQFYTDQLLEQAQIPFHQGFDPQHLQADLDLVLHSQAYDQQHSEVSRAIELQLPLLSYPQALGQISMRFPFALAVAGVHGKTTTTLMLGTILQQLALPATVWAGGNNPLWQNKPLWVGGEQLLVAETCEYRRHFLNFHADALLLLTVDWDHQDYFHTLEQMEQAFLDFIATLPEAAPLIYNADDTGVRRLIAQLPHPESLTLLPYGRLAPAPFTTIATELKAGENMLNWQLCPQPLYLHCPGEHLLENAAAAMSAAYLLWFLQRRSKYKHQQANQVYPATKTPSNLEDNSLSWQLQQQRSYFPWQQTARALASFRGASRRSEVLGESAGILFIDDYAHHPTAIKTTLAGFRRFYPHRRLVVDFMAHTYSRTQALWADFLLCFDEADLLLLHPIYASAREASIPASISQSFAAAIAAKRPAASTIYCIKLFDALPSLRQGLRSGDLFVSLGAGNNRPLAEAYLAELQQNNQSILDSR